jgi:hypothetical protein
MPRSLLAVALLLLFAIPARAQFGFFGGSSYDPMAEPATTAEVDRLARDCGMDEAAAAGARSLVEACNTTLQRNARRASRMWEKLYLTHPREDFEDTEAFRETFQKESEKQRAAHDECAKTLLSDLRALVPEGRDAAWDSFERRRHRRL